MLNNQPGKGIEQRTDLMVPLTVLRSNVEPSGVLSDWNETEGLRDSERKATKSGRQLVEIYSIATHSFKFVSSEASQLENAMALAVSTLRWDNERAIKLAKEICCKINVIEFTVTKRS